jgi:hypothetical protein
VAPQPERGRVDIGPSSDSHSSIVDSGRLLIHGDLRETVDEIRKAHIILPQPPSALDISVDSYGSPWELPLLEPIEDKATYKLDRKHGESLSLTWRSISAYDESIRKYAALEGTAYLVCHSLVTLSDRSYIPLNLLTFRFYTRASKIAEGTKFIRYSENPSVTSEQDYMDDKIGFLVSFAPANSVLLIDGPLIAGDAYVRMIAAVDKFHARGILPIWFVKNSESNVVIENSPELKDRFNSDLHWANSTLTPGSRSRFYRYTDQNNPRNSKVFCYLRAMPVSPQRVEIHSSTFAKDPEEIRSAMDLVNYLILVQGKAANPQARPIAVAEQYARETMRLTDIRQMARQAGLHPTMNEERFGG